MRCLRDFARHYYQEFYDPLRLLRDSGVGPLVLLFLLLFLGFCWLAVAEVVAHGMTLRAQVLSGALVLTEAILLSLLLVAMVMCDRAALRRYQRIMGWRLHSIDDLKARYLRGWLGQRRALSVVEDIRKGLQALDEGNGVFAGKTDRRLGSMLFPSEARARVLALFIFVCSALLALSVRSGADLSDLFAFTQSAGGAAPVLYVSLVAVGFLTLQLARELAGLIFAISVWFSEVWLGGKRGGSGLIRILCRDLVEYCSEN